MPNHARTNPPNKTKVTDVVRANGAEIDKIPFHDTHYFKGVVEAHQGYVQVYSQHDHDYTYLSFVHAGKNYFRTFMQFYQPRTLVTLAARFAVEMVQISEYERLEAKKNHDKH